MKTICHDIKSDMKTTQHITVYNINVALVIAVGCKMYLNIDYNAISFTLLSQ